MARREMAQALTRVMERKHEVAAVEGSLMQVAYREANDSFTFSNKDLVNQVVDGDWPLYITAFLGHLKLKGLIDTGASTNILPLLTFDALGIPIERIIPKPLQVARIEALQQSTLGHVFVDLKVGAIWAPILMHVMEGSTFYHIILGRPWMKAYKVVASTYHLCLKAVWRNNQVVIKATKMPFDKAKLHFAKAALYQEYELKGENRTLPFNPIALQVEEEGDGEVVEPERPSKIRRVAGPDGRVIYEF